MTRLRALGVIFGLALLSLSCVEGAGPPLGPDGAGFPTLQLALQPDYAAAVSGESLPIRRIRLTATRVETGRVLVRTVLEVDPQAEGWDVPLDIPVDPEDVGGLARVLVEMLSVENGVERVEWSGLAGPFPIRSGQETRSETVALFRGPPGNLAVTGVAVEGGPLSLVEGGSGRLTVRVEGSDEATVFWGSLDPGVAQVDAEGRVVGMAPGTTRVVAEAGPRSDTAQVQVRARLESIRLSVAGTPTATLEVDALQDDVDILAEGLDPRGDPIAGLPLRFELSSEGVLEPRGDAPGAFRTVGTGNVTVRVTSPSDPGVESPLQVVVTQRVVGVEMIPPVLELTYLGEERELGLRGWDRNGVEVPGAAAAAVWTLLPGAGGGPTVELLQNPLRVRALATGPATVQVAVGTASAAATVGVTQLPSTLEVDPAAILLPGPGEGAPVTAYLRDAGGAVVADAGFTWTATPAGVVEIVGSGASVEVVGVAPGEATLQVTSAALTSSIPASVGRPAARIRLLTGGASEGLAGSAVSPLPSFVVEGADGVAVAGASVAFATAGGVVTPASALSGPGGVVGPSNWTLGPTAGPQTLTATLVGVTGAGPLSVSAVVQAAALPVRTLVLFEGDGEPEVEVETAVPVAPRVRLLEGGNTPVPGVTVTFTVQAGSGSVTPATAVTAADGTAGVSQWLVGSEPGLNILWAQAPGVTDPVIFRAMAVAAGSPEPPPPPPPPPPPGSPTWLFLGWDGEWDSYQLSSPDGAVWTSAVWPGPPVTFYSLVYGGGQWVLCCESGYSNVLTSPDGETWTQRTGGLAILGWNGTRYVSVGSGGGIETSDDGITWTPRVSGTTNFFNGVGWNGAEWMAAASGGLIRVSGDNGATWQARASGTTNALGAVVWTGTHWIVAGQNSTIRTSPDGVTWTPRTAPGVGFVSHGTWTGTHAVLVTYQGHIWTSSDPDGSTWTQEFHDPSLYFNAVHSDGTQTFAFGDENTLLERVGGSWVPRDAGDLLYAAAGAAVTSAPVNLAPTVAVTSPTAGANFPAGDPVSFLAFALDPEDGLLDGANVLWTSNLDGGLGSGASISVPLTTEGVHTITVTATDSYGALARTSFTLNITAATPPDPEWMAVGLDGDGIAWSLHSPDGVSWSPVNLGLNPFTMVNGVVHGNGVWVAYGNGFVNAYTPGSGWFDVTPGTPFDSYYDAFWNGERFMLVGSAGTVWTSTTGVFWNQPTPQLGPELRSVGWNGFTWIVTSSGGDIFGSTDNGVTWEPRASGTTQQLQSVHWNGRFWMAAGGSSTLLLSEDTYQWTPLSPAAGSYVDLTYTIANGTFLAGLQSIQVSPGTSGASWSTEYTTEPGESLWGIASDGTHTIAVGYPELILERDGGAWTPLDPEGIITFRGIGTRSPVPLALAPTVEITSHSSPISMTVGSAVVVEVDTYDYQTDGPVSPFLISWSSDLDSFLGTGTSLNLSGLTVGNHTVTITVSESNGATSVVLLEVEVNPAAPPAPGFLLWGEYVNGSAEQRAFASADGSSWPQVSVIPSPPGAPTRMLWGDGAFHLLTQNQGFLRSTDGMGWTDMSPDSPPAGADFRVGVYGDDRWVLMESWGHAWSSEDGVNWTRVTDPLGIVFTPNAIGWNGNFFVAVGANTTNDGVIGYSPDGVTWWQAPLPLVSTLTGITWNGSIWVAVGNGGAVLYSPDGITWVPTGIGAGPSSQRVVWTGTEFLTVGVAGDVRVWTSTNAVIWTEDLPASFDGSFTDLATGDGVTVITGFDVGGVTVRRRALGSWTSATQPDATFPGSVASSNPPVVNQAPKVSFVGPVPADITIGDPVTVEATAVDNEEPMYLADLEWYSDVDGFLDTGATLDLSVLSGGVVHTISVRITDSNGAVGVAQFEVEVNLI